MKTFGALAALLLAPLSIGAIPSGGLAASAPTAVVAYETPAGIVTANINGTHPVLRVAGAFHPTVSRDGRQLVFARYDAISKQTFWYVSTITGAGAHRIGDGLPTLGQPCWSPDGTRLVMSNGSQLAVVTVATGAVTTIPGTAGETSPEWSPDGTLIAAASRGGGQVLQRPDGSSRVIRPDATTGPWSADGRHMLALPPSYGSLFAVDVLTGARQSLGYVREDYGYPGMAWAPSAPGTLSAFLGVDSWLPWDPGTTTVYRFDAIDGDLTGTPTAITIASPASYPSAGGFSITDTNGAPPAVTLGTMTVSPSYVHLAWTPPAATPDAAGVEIRYALGDTPPATVTDGLDGGRLLTTSRVLGPFPPDQHVAISIFSRDWTGHVGPAVTTTAVVPHAAAVTVTAHAVPFDLTAGQRTTITVSATRDFDHSPVVGATIAVGRRAWPTSNPYQPLTTLHTGADGTAVMTQIPSQSYDYLLTYGGDADHASRAIGIRVRVARRAHLTADRTSGAPGTFARLTVTTAPPLAGGKTYLQRYTTRFVDVGPHNTTTLGTAVFMVPFPRHGVSVQYRVRIPGVNGYTDSVTGIITLTGT